MTKKDNKQKIKFAIWLHNQLIDKFPEIYKSMKERYEELKK